MCDYSLEILRGMLNFETLILKKYHLLFWYFDGEKNDFEMGNVEKHEILAIETNWKRAILNLRPVEINSYSNSISKRPDITIKRFTKNEFITYIYYCAYNIEHKINVIVK